MTQNERLRKLFEKFALEEGYNKLNLDESYKRKGVSTRWFHASPYKFSEFNSKLKDNPKGHENFVFFADNPFIALSYLGSTKKEKYIKGYVYEIEFPSHLDYEVVDHKKESWQNLLETYYGTEYDNHFWLFYNVKDTTISGYEYLTIYEAFRTLNLSPKEVVQYYEEFVKRESSILAIPKPLINEVSILSIKELKTLNIKEKSLATITRASVAYVLNNRIGEDSSFFAYQKAWYYFFGENKSTVIDQVKYSKKLEMLLRPLIKLNNNEPLPVFIGPYPGIPYSDLDGILDYLSFNNLKIEDYTGFPKFEDANELPKDTQIALFY